MHDRCPSLSANRILALLAGGVAFLITAPSTFARDMEERTEKRVKRAAVQVWMGESVEGQKEHKWHGSGSGSFINRTGLVITNNHVVDPGHGQPPQVKFAARYQYSVLKYRVIMNAGTDGEKEYEAIVLYQNESADIAVLQALDKNGEPLEVQDYLTLYPSANVEKGDRLWCFGFPGGDKMSTRQDKHAEVTVTAGNVIGVPRSAGGRLPWIDTDVGGAPGNSGGPLCNADGQMIGVLSQGHYEDAEESGSGVKVRIVPADLVADMVRVAVAMGKISSKSDLEPFLHLLAGKDGQVYLPGMERNPRSILIRFKNGDELVAESIDKDLVFKTALGPIKVPSALAAYAVGEDGKASLFLDGGDRLSADADDVEISFTTNRGRKLTIKMSDVAKIAFKERSEVLEKPDVRGVLIEGEGCRVLLRDIEGTVTFTSATGDVELKVENLRRIETRYYKQIVSTADGAKMTGKFAPDSFKAKLAWTGAPVTLSLEKVRFATFKHYNPSNARGVALDLAGRLAIDDRHLVEIAQMLEDNQLIKASALLDEQLVKSKLRELPGPAREQAKVLGAERLLRKGEYDAARAGFKKLRRAKLENVKWYAASRYLLLDQCAGGVYHGKPLSDPAVFDMNAEQLASESIDDARGIMKSYSKAKPDSHSAWKSLVKELEDHTEQLQIAASLDPGRGENDIFRLWRFRQNLNSHEFRRLSDERKELRRKLEDFKNDGGRSARSRAKALNRKLDRLNNRYKETLREIEDMHAMMEAAGFRLDDPAAIDILD